MGLKRASLVLYILFIFPLHHTFPSVNSLPSSADTNHNTLSLINASKPDVVSFEGKARELAVVIKEEEDVVVAAAEVEALEAVEAVQEAWDV
ncbi:hypothetical protein Bca52824_079494 [Brassica carinata]|uniref:Uncharacterized protein n=1 Tax=Brassica carinata TaxID=52824 RepID=A0A8X7Q045_BRACI|nr:hypothetical protein Bca52824_079494 [Brassica carinata]